MIKEQCDIGTLASTFNSKRRKSNVVKVALKEKISPNVFSNAIDFFRINND